MPFFKGIKHKKSLRQLLSGSSSKRGSPSASGDVSSSEDGNATTSPPVRSVFNPTDALEDSDVSRSRVARRPAYLVSPLGNNGVQLSPLGSHPPEHFASPEDSDELLLFSVNRRPTDPLSSSQARDLPLSSRARRPADRLPFSDDSGVHLFPSVHRRPTDPIPSSQAKDVPLFPLARRPTDRYPAKHSEVLQPTVYRPPGPVGTISEHHRNSSGVSLPSFFLSKSVLGHADMSGRVDINFYWPGEHAAVYVVTSASTPPWELLQMNESHYRPGMFNVCIEDVQEGLYQYKIRVGEHDWVVDRSQETTFDNSGNENNVVHTQPASVPVEQKQSSDSPAIPASVVEKADNEHSCGDEFGEDELSAGPPPLPHEAILPVEDTSDELNQSPPLTYERTGTLSERSASGDNIADIPSIDYPSFVNETKGATPVSRRSSSSRLFKPRSHSSSLPHRMPRTDEEDENLLDPSLDTFPTNRDQVFTRVQTLEDQLLADETSTPPAAMHSPDLTVSSQACSSVDLVPIGSHSSLRAIAEDSVGEVDEEEDGTSLPSPVLEIPPRGDVPVQTSSSQGAGSGNELKAPMPAEQHLEAPHVSAKAQAGAGSLQSHEAKSSQRNGGTKDRWKRWAMYLEPPRKSPPMSPEKEYAAAKEKMDYVFAGVAGGAGTLDQEAAPSEPSHRSPNTTRDTAHSSAAAATEAHTTTLNSSNIRRRHLQTMSSDSMDVYPASPLSSAVTGSTASPSPIAEDSRTPTPPEGAQEEAVRNGNTEMSPFSKMLLTGICAIAIAVIAFVVLCWWLVFA